MHAMALRPFPSLRLFPSRGRRPRRATGSANLIDSRSNWLTRSASLATEDGRGKEVETVVFVQTALIRARSWAAQRGQGLVEYALMLALIAIVAIAALTFLGGQLSGILGEIGQSV